MDSNFKSGKKSNSKWYKNVSEDKIDKKEQNTNIKEIITK